MLPDNFAVFIICHEKPNCIKTLDSLNRSNYTGKWYIILDDKDRTIEQYKKNYGEDRVLIFSKDEIKKSFDTMDMGENQKCIVYARNACFELARSIGIKYFVELDDDYVEFRFRFSEDGVKLKSAYPNDLDSAFEYVLDFYKAIPEIKSVAIAQMGDFIGGTDSKVYKEQITRKCMNSFFCDIDRPFTFNGTINEDVNTYCLNGSRGDLFFTIRDIALNQDETQSHSGSMTDLYLMGGTYLKSFYSVLCCPSFVKLDIMGNGHYRIHHHVYWENAVPKIISDKFKKE